MADQTPHPLLIPLVIQEFMSYIHDFEMWKRCRLVCKTWHDSLLQPWRKGTNVCYGDVWTNKPVMTESSFCEAFKMKFLNLDKTPFRHIITREETDPEKRVVVEVARSSNFFWTTCGPWLHVIKFNHVDFYNYNQLNNIIFQGTPNLKHLEFYQCLFYCSDDGNYGLEFDECNQIVDPNYQHFDISQVNLKTLKISVLPNNSGFGRFPIYIMTLLSVFTQLEELCLEEFRKEYWTLTHLLDALEDVRKFNQKPVLNLKRLYLKKLDNFLSADFPEIFSNLELPLEELSLQIDYALCDDNLQKILNEYSKLTKLELGRCRETAPSTTFQTSLINAKYPSTLTELSLYEFGFENWDWKFLATTPLLKKLVLTQLKDVEDENILILPRCLPQMTPHVGYLTDFTFNVSWIPSIELVEKFGEMMPNVATLSITADADVFKTVCRIWPSLTNWRITYAPNVLKGNTFSFTKLLKNLKSLHVNYNQYPNTDFHEVYFKLYWGKKKSYKLGFRNK